MARFGPRADKPPIFGPGQAGPIYKHKTGPKWADGPSRAGPLKNRPGPGQNGPGRGPTQAYSKYGPKSKCH